MKIISKPKIINGIVVFIYIYIYIHIYMINETVLINFCMIYILLWYIDFQNSFSMQYPNLLRVCSI